VGENPGDHARILDRRDDLHRPAAGLAGLDVDGEDPSQALGPGHGAASVGWAFVSFCSWLPAPTLAAPRGGDLAAPGVRWREEAVVTNEVRARARNERREPCHEVHRLQKHVGLARSPGRLQLVADVAIRREREALVGHRRSCHVAAQALELVPLPGLRGHAGVQGEAVGFCDVGRLVRVIAKRYAGAAGLTVSEGHTGSVTLIQRFGSALNANVHLHMLFLDGVYVEHHGKAHFRRVSAPFKTELEVLVRQISERVGRHLERRGLLERDLESSWLTLDSTDEDDGMNALLGHSITYRVAVGPRAGQKAFTLQTLPPLPERADDEPPHVAKANGFSLHAGVAAEAWERDKLERLCRYITRPPVAEKRLSLAPDGRIRYELKSAWRDGTTAILLEPMDFMARLAALVPRPRVNLTRYHGLFAPAHSLRGQVTPARRGKGGRPKPPPDADDQPAHPRRSMTWAQRLRRVFNIDIETCEACGGPVKVIAAIEDPGVITRILSHLEEREAQESRPPARGPPSLFD